MSESTFFSKYIYSNLEPIAYAMKRPANKQENNYPEPEPSPGSLSPENGLYSSHTETYTPEPEGSVAEPVVLGSPPDVDICKRSFYVSFT